MTAIDAYSGPQAPIYTIYDAVQKYPQASVIVNGNFCDSFDFKSEIGNKAEGMLIADGVTQPSSGGKFLKPSPWNAHFYLAAMPNGSVGINPGELDYATGNPMDGTVKVYDQNWNLLRTDKFVDAMSGLVGSTSIGWISPLLPDGSPQFPDGVWTHFDEEDSLMIGENRDQKILFLAPTIPTWSSMYHSHPRPLVAPGTVGLAWHAFDAKADVVCMLDGGTSIALAHGQRLAVEFRSTKHLSRPIWWAYQGLGQYRVNSYLAFTAGTP